MACAGRWHIAKSQRRAEAGCFGLQVEGSRGAQAGGLRWGNHLATVWLASRPQARRRKLRRRRAAAAHLPGAHATTLSAGTLSATACKGAGLRESM